MENPSAVTWMLPLPAGLSPSQGHFDDHIPGTYNHEQRGQAPKMQEHKLLTNRMQQQPRHRPGAAIGGLAAARASVHEPLSTAVYSSAVRRAKT